MKGYLKGVDIKYKDNEINYGLNIDDDFFSINNSIGDEMNLVYCGDKKCIYCGREIKGKTFNNGYCYPCFRDLPQNDICMVRPERCHYSKGSCRDEKFAENYCLEKHFIYLAYTSEIKVGITHHGNIPSRWLNQGATKGCVIAEVPQRKVAGDVENFLMDYFADKTNWRGMLKNNEVKSLDQAIEKAQRLITDKFHDVNLVKDDKSIRYPWVYPPKVKSINLDKINCFTSRLLGAKGQYLIFEDGVLNLKKYRGYNIEINFSRKI
ncbi:DUF2797 domain-containing protein [Proteinivorax tanatarense]|uniref:DUF2797 domain-containing protein n=1 Tax=Proteinivorax tanatarense TaxID=1260629 RepID=A0AAU7VNG4_9FIRM